MEATWGHRPHNFFAVGAIAPIAPWSRRLCDDATTHSATTEVIEITICVRFYCDTTAIRLRLKTDVHFLLASNWKQARAIRRSRIVVVSWSNRNCNHGIIQSSDVPSGRRTRDLLISSTIRRDLYTCTKPSRNLNRNATLTT